jgi:hypothetical protein
MMVVRARLMRVCRSGRSSRDGPGDFQYFARSRGGYRQEREHDRQDSSQHARDQTGVSARGTALGTGAIDTIGGCVRKPVEVLESHRCLLAKKAQIT